MMEGDEPGERLDINQLRVFRGRQTESELYIYDDYSYHRDNRVPGILRCASRGESQCAARLYIDENNHFFLSGHHEEPPRPWVLRVYEFRAEIAQLATNSPGLAPAEVWRRLVPRYQDIAEVRVRIGQARGIIRSVRRGLRPPLPRTLDDLHDTLGRYFASMNSYRSRVQAAGGGTAFVFISNFMLNHLNDATELMMDGTFSITPAIHPRFTQVFVIFRRRINQDYPVVYVLMTRRTTALYRAIFQLLKQLAPRLEASLQSVLSDFELALVAAVREEFPLCHITGCNFHFRQALLRRWLRLGLRRVENRTALYMAWILLFVPLLRWHEALELIQQELDNIAGEFNNALQFGHYLRNYWLQLAHVVFAGSCVITNNIAEAWNRWARRYFGRHRGIFDFLDSLNKDMAVQQARWVEGHVIVNRNWIRQAQEQVRMQDILNLPGLAQMRHFLTIAIGPYQHNHRLNDFRRYNDENDDNDNMDEVAHPDHLLPMPELEIPQMINNNNNNNINNNINNNNKIHRGPRIGEERRVVLVVNVPEPLTLNKSIKTLNKLIKTLSKLIKTLNKLIKTLNK